ncbi:NADH-ubiquinone oxidoreductase [Komagataeibacter intermedius]|uniref:NADH-ubiquinone oxidoreductase n=2 Tax=Komagataeibacter intermedius TaxID=66229 RepID=A0A0N1N5C8_9PROT|nr:NADH-ubiquinone oxidoreductase [Komagataeibacter intermedius]KPH85705.1 NADH-ubiquinone oxidoreductase [Komagataeibacter intermedius AF2]MCF3636604.1 NADH-ubiquinone oxidoreductase [Komagataeibacter intermedius]GAN86848.1 NADH-ubiquinone oxidoreductase 39-40 kDa subunit [Komagataeibacter intermedius TF2]GBQ67164.1 NADH-ubiquinone oxidoreductase 39-40 kDa subunit [Komagataeibacter intermedius NRIC 0521]
MPGGGPVHVIGATGRSGLALCHALKARGRAIIPVVRSLPRWQATGMACPARVADLLADPAALRAALADATSIVLTTHARHLPAVLAAAPDTARIVALGSTRIFTRWPDAHARGVLHGAQALARSGRNGVLLHPTMIYGATGEDNVQRLAALMHRLPILPLPGGGASRIQPIWQGDVTRAILAALDRQWNGPHSLIIAGSDQISYRDFTRHVARAAGMWPRPVVPVPGWLLIAAARLHPPGLPRIMPAEVRRLLEDKIFDIAPMRTQLGLAPTPLSVGLERTFGRPG